MMPNACPQKRSLDSLKPVEGLQAFYFGLHLVAQRPGGEYFHGIAARKQLLPEVESGFHAVLEYRIPFTRFHLALRVV